MLNLRQIDDHYFLAGGWEDLEEDAGMLEAAGVKGILDLQFTPEDEPSMALAVHDALEAVGIEYRHIPLFDYPEYYLPSQLEHAGEVGHKILSEWDEKYNGREEMLLVKCSMGTSRSAFILLYHLCSRNGTSYLRELYSAFDAESWATNIGISLNSGFHQFMKEKFPEEEFEW